MSNFFDRFFIYPNDDESLITDDDENKGEHRGFEDSKRLPDAVLYILIGDIFLWIGLINKCPITLYTAMMMTFTIGTPLHIMIIMFDFFDKRRVDIKRLLVPILVFIMGVALLYARNYMLKYGVDLLLFD